MKNSLRILLVLAVIVGVLPILASAYPINDTDVSVCFKIDDGDQSDLHAKNGWLVAGSGTTTSTIQVACAVNMSVIHYVRFTSLEKDTYGDVVGDRVTTAPIILSSLHQRMWQEMHRYRCRSIIPISQVASGMTITGLCTNGLIIIFP